MSWTCRTCVRTGASTLLVLAAFACGEPTAPASLGTSGPSFSKTATGLNRLLIARDHPAKPERASAAIGPKGGTIALPGAGVTLVVPPGALARTVTITVRTNSRDFVSYGFAPHGLVFEKPVEILQSRNGIREQDGGTVGGYLAHGRMDIDESGVGHLAEVLQTHHDDATMGFFITHFSGYVLASGVAAPDVPVGVDR